MGDEEGDDLRFNNSILHIENYLLYLFGVCLVPQVSGRFEGNIIENHTSEHVDAGLHLLIKKRKI